MKDEILGSEGHHGKLLQIFSKFGSTTHYPTPPNPLASQTKPEKSPLLWSNDLWLLLETGIKDFLALFRHKSRSSPPPVRSKT